jgi:hypothetical protein
MGKLHDEGNAQERQAREQGNEQGEGDVVSGLKNKMQSAVANVTPAERLAKQHRQMAEPGTSKS